MNSSISTQSYAWRVIASACVVLVLVSCSNEKTDAEHVQQGRLYQEQNNWQAAVIEYKNALQINPQSTDARRALGVIYLESGDGAAAEKELRRMFDSAKADPTDTTLLARALLLQNQHEKLLTEFPPAPEATGSESAELDGVRAEALAKLGKLEPAQALIDRAVACDTPTPALMLNAARIASARGDLPKARDWAQRASQSAPSNAAAWLLVGDLAYAGGQFDDAVTVYQKSLELDARQLQTQRSAHAHIGLVYTLLTQNKPDAALPHIEKILQANPKHFLGNYLRGLTAFKKTDFTTALDYLQRSAQDAPVNSPTFSLLGAVHYSLGNFQQAETYLSKYVAAVPDDMSSRKLLATVRLKLNQPEKALEALGKTEASKGDAQALSLMGEAAAQRGDFTRSRELFRSALKTTKESGKLQAQLAQTWAAEGEYDHALAQLELAAQDPEFRNQARVLSVTTYLRKQDYSAALKAAQALVAEQPGDADMNNVMGGVFLASGDRTKARTSFQHVLELQPNFLPGLLNLAALEANEKNYAAARARWMRVLEIEPQHTAALLSLAHLDDTENHPEAAIGWLEKARLSSSAAIEPRILLGRRYLQQREPEKAETIAHEAVEAHPDVPAALLLLGDTQLVRQKLDQAISTYKKFTNLLPKDATGFLRLGQAQFVAKQYLPARASLRNAYVLAPDSISIIAASVALETRTNDTNVALQRVDDYLKKHPNSPEGHELRGEVMMAQGKYLDADRSYARAAEFAPSGALVIKRQQALSKASREDAALEVLIRWLDLHPRDQMVQVVLAETHRARGRNAEAAEVYRQILAEKPDDITALNNLALVYLATSDARAKSVGEKAYIQSRGHPFISDTYGWVLLQLGDVEQGKQLLEQAADKAPDQPDIQVHLAVALARSGDAFRARDVLTRVLKQSKSFETRALAEETLAKLEKGR